jgi:hypothetical protein
LIRETKDYRLKTQVGGQAWFGQFRMASVNFTLSNVENYHPLRSLHSLSYCHLPGIQRIFI